MNPRAHLLQPVSPSTRDTHSTIILLRKTRNTFAHVCAPESFERGEENNNRKYKHARTKNNIHMHARTHKNIHMNAHTNKSINMHIHARVLPGAFQRDQHERELRQSEHVSLLNIHTHHVTTMFI